MSYALVATFQYHHDHSRGKWLKVKVLQFISDES
jgi:hypothetical protein